MKAVILHGGQGTRLRPLTHTGPKQLLKIAGKPVSLWGILSLRDLGIRDFAIILGNNHPEKVVEFYGDGSVFDINVTYIYQGEAFGLADAIYKAKDFVGNDRFVVYLGDNVVLDGLKNLINFNGEASILLAKVNNPNRFGVAVINEGKVIKLVEKPKEFISDLALVGVYAFTPSIFNSIEKIKPSWRGELEITDAIQELLNEGKEVNYSIVEGWWKDTGTPEDLLEANMILLDRFLEREIIGKISGKIEGRVKAENCIIENSTVRGPVYIGRNSVIKNSFIGPYTTIGDNCIIENSEISNSLIMDEAQISNVSIIDSIVGEKAKISKKDGLPSGRKIIVGENSIVEV
ncbi:glucose-1-phosphate thymidylyltransferase [Acidianus brierleyi]|uniref:Glucose-1-phosphate thymidylyltransferase n=1 Tax=Acidianus brierleyi TaxID=41673 RepID=A0A2U9IGQ2_9CREN|nr:glucose-1-phosphate thymidylyltransferase [Acidianus brierleyi]AWR95221.1 glucose-1-phosphate thymidylyltransferase [Acidianus brierleyi]